MKDPWQSLISFPLIRGIFAGVGGDKRGRGDGGSSQWGLEVLRGVKVG